VAEQKVQLGWSNERKIRLSQNKREYIGYMRPDNFSLQRATNVQYVDMNIDEMIENRKENIGVIEK
jgi:hypothetical protein